MNIYDRPTPETDTEISKFFVEGDSGKQAVRQATQHWNDMADHARLLERQRDAAVELLGEAIQHVHGNALRMRKQFAFENGEELYANAMQLLDNSQEVLRAIKERK